MSWWRYEPYVNVAMRRARAAKKLSQLAKKGYVAEPVKIAGRTISTTFWGKAWCDHLQSYGDFANRLPRGRTYVRNGSVVDLQITPGKITAQVVGSDFYQIGVEVKPLTTRAWNALKSRCAGRIGSLIELLQGRLSHDVMEVVTHRTQGLFPQPGEISMECSCPDWADMCKHLAAVLYGVGARLDRQPELLFRLRQVPHQELIAGAAEAAKSTTRASRGKKTTIAVEDLGDVFGIELDESVTEDIPAGEDSRPEVSAQRAARTVKKQASDAAKTKSRRSAVGSRVVGSSTRSDRMAVVLRKVETGAASKRKGGKATLVATKRKARSDKTGSSANKMKAKSTPTRSKPRQAR